MEMQDIKKEILNAGINIEEIALGHGCNPRKISGRKSRYYMSTTNKTHRFAIQYCKDIEQYIAWRNDTKVSLSKHSVIAESVPRVEEKEIATTKKGREFAWRMKEDVYTFKKEGIVDFLEKYVVVN